MTVRPSNQFWKRELFPYAKAMYPRLRFKSIPPITFGEQPRTSMIAKDLQEGVVEAMLGLSQLDVSLLLWGQILEEALEFHPISVDWQALSRLRIG